MFHFVWDGEVCVSEWEKKPKKTKSDVLLEMLISVSCTELKIRLEVLISERSTPSPCLPPEHGSCLLSQLLLPQAFEMKHLASMENRYFLISLLCYLG